MHSKTYKTISFIVAILGFISGIICGNVFKTVTVRNAALGLYREHFNTTVMICVWIVTIFLFLIFFGIYTILSNQETIISKLNNNNDIIPETNVIEPIVENETGANISNIIETINDREPSANQVKCPHCGNIQRNTVQRCLRCSNLINE